MRPVQFNRAQSFSDQLDTSISCCYHISINTLYKTKGIAMTTTRTCKFCGADISHKRLNAQKCDARECRNQYARENGYTKIQDRKKPKPKRKTTLRNIPKELTKLVNDIQENDNITWKLMDIKFVIGCHVCGGKLSEFRCYKNSRRVIASFITCIECNETDYYDENYMLVCRAPRITI